MSSKYCFKAFDNIFRMKIICELKKINKIYSEMKPHKKF